MPVATVASHTDTLTFCISKGLCAPVGAVLVGPRAFITRARAFRRMVGGNLRQGGSLAAAGLVALDEMVDRLADDHIAARLLADGLHQIDPRLVERDRVETNIVQVDTRASGHTAAEWIAALDAEGVRAGAWSSSLLRLVTHRHIGAAEIARALAAFAMLSERFAPARGAAD